MLSSNEPQDVPRTAGLTAGRNVELNPVVVEAVDGPGRGSQLLLTAGTVFVGRGPECDLVVDDEAVSRSHACLSLLPGAVKLKDLGSSNGTRYLGARIAEAMVPVGGTVSIGRTTLRFRLQDQPGPLCEREELCGIIGKSPAMRRLFATLDRVGPSSSTVLIHGESGTGKELVARALHALSPRADKPFVTVDASTLTQELAESELFGHARGAFTGADRARGGLLEAAQGGTLFFDEIGELALPLQAKLLRALESRTFRRVGETTLRQLDARVIAATHRDLSAEVAAERWRSDLYHRLAVLVVTVPPLRARREDIPQLATHFAQALGHDPAELSPSVLAALQCEAWPGNVRELRNAIERVLALAPAAPGAAPQSASADAFTFSTARGRLVDDFESDFLRAVLERNGGNVSAASREAKISRRQFYRLIEKHQLRTADSQS